MIRIKQTKGNTHFKINHQICSAFSKISYFRSSKKWFRGRVARQSSAKARTAVRICSKPLFKFNKKGLPGVILFLIFMKHSQLIGIAASLAVIGICYLPWVFIASNNTTVTGMYSGETTFGRPGEGRRHQSIHDQCPRKGT